MYPETCFKMFQATKRLRSKHDCSTVSGRCENHIDFSWWIQGKCLRRGTHLCRPLSWNGPFHSCSAREPTNHDSIESWGTRLIHWPSAERNNDGPRCKRYPRLMIVAALGSFIWRRRAVIALEQALAALQHSAFAFLVNTLNCRMTSLPEFDEQGVLRSLLKGLMDAQCIGTICPLPMCLPGRPASSWQVGFDT